MIPRPVTRERTSLELQDVKCQVNGTTDITHFSKWTLPGAFQVPEGSHIALGYTLTTTNVKAGGNPIMKTSPGEKTR